MSKGQKLQELIDRSLNNIDEDRAAANKLLTDLLIYMAKTGDAAHAASGHIAAQYLETLQRSNEQLVKIAALMQKQDGNNRGLSENEKNNLFDMIREK
jgi:hypothetical protein